MIKKCPVVFNTCILYCVCSFQCRIIVLCCLLLSSYILHLYVWDKFINIVLYFFNVQINIVINSSSRMLIHQISTTYLQIFVSVLYFISLFIIHLITMHCILLSCMIYELVITSIYLYL